MKELIIPVIPMEQVVLFPTTLIPLVVVEKSYIDMVKKAHREDGLIALSLSQTINGPLGESMSGRFHVHDICSAGKPVIIGEDKEGLKILMRGQARIEILETLQKLPYIKVRARTLPDIEFSDQELVNAPVEKLVQIFQDWVELHIRDSLERESFIEKSSTVKHIIDYICSYIIQAPETRQLMLEKRSLVDRIKILDALLKDDNPFCEDQMVAHALHHYEVLIPSEFKQASGHH